MLVFGALGGIATAVIASLVALIAKLYRPKVTTLGRAPGGEADEDFRFRDIERHPECETFPGLVIVRFGGELFFANATYLRSAVSKLAVGADPPVREVILDASAIPRLDTTAADVVVDLVDELDAANVRARPRAGEPPAAHRSAPLRPRGRARHLRRVARRRCSARSSPGRRLGRIIQKR